MEIWLNVTFASPAQRAQREEIRGMWSGKVRCIRMGDGEARTQRGRTIIHSGLREGPSPSVTIYRWDICSALLWYVCHRSVILARATTYGMQMR